MNKRSLLFTLLAVVCAVMTMAQGRLELRFNEVMTRNDSSLIDQYGRHEAWVEVFNRSYGTVGMEQMFISNEKIDISKRGDKKAKDYLNELAKENPQMIYEIPRGDSETKVAPRSHVIFFADGETALGAMHLSFRLDPEKENTLYLYDVNGDLVDAVTVPVLIANHSYALIEDGKSEIDRENGTFEPKNWQECDNESTDEAGNIKVVSPRKFNRGVINENIEKFYKNDPSGITIALIAMGIVFSALLLLCILFYLFGLVNKKASQNDMDKTNEETASRAVDQPVAAATGGDDEVMAAICMALYQHLNAHDNESGVLTFNRNDQTAWGSKANLMRQLPERR